MNYFDCQYRVYLVTQEMQHDELLERVRICLKAGASMLQWREKRELTSMLIAQARELRKIAEQFNISFIVNDYVELVETLNAQGVHIGQKDGKVATIRQKYPNLLIGCSVTTVKEAITAQQEGADYLGVGAMFDTTSKNDAEKVSIETLKAICEAVRIPVVAIGGISVDNIEQLADCPISGVAVIKALLKAEDSEKATMELLNKVKKIKRKMKPILSIAGSDCSGGAGVEADIKTITSLGHYAMSAITALTAQNTLEVRKIYPIPSSFLATQLEVIFDDIYPVAIKIGMVFEASIIEAIATQLKRYGAKKVVLDPVMISTSGATLLSKNTEIELIQKLFPLATLITPNLYEAQHLSGVRITNGESMQQAAKKIAETFDGSILIKGGHLQHCADDLLYENGEFFWIKGEKVETQNTHGTGCTLSSAIACFLAEGNSIYESVCLAKAYITGALKENFSLGKGNGPLYHSYQWK